jgi:hypothetical protein
MTHDPGHPTPARPLRWWHAALALWIFGVAAFYYLRLSLLLFGTYRDEIDALFRRVWGE